MTRRKVEIIAAFVLLILLVVFLIWLFLRQPREVEQPTEEQTIATDELPPVNPADIPQQSTVAAITVSRTFIERFGSYSSQSDFANIDDVLSLATERFQTELQGLVTQYRAATSSDDEYTGVSTYVISTKTVSETAQGMMLAVTTQRRESVGTPGNSTLRYQDVEIVLVKNGDSWLVDGLTWK